MLVKLAPTAASRIVFETLDYALSQRGMVLVEGTYRIGKSFAAQAWAQTHLGDCRYVQLSSARDDNSFYRDFARALGVAHSTQMKAREMRNRVEEVLRRQHLLLVIDEADYLWDGAIRVRETPVRVSWLMTSVINNGVPVALVASRNFSRLMAHVEACCPIWGSEQFHGRIRLRRTLPDSLEPEDLSAICDLLLPESEKAARLLLVSHALRSEGYVAALESGASRAKFFAGKEGRATVAFGDVEAVMRECGTYRPPKPAPRPAASAGEPSASRPRKHREAPASSRLPLGAAAGPIDFTGTRPPGLLR